jgi:hypothetical protein
MKRFILIVFISILCIVGCSPSDTQKQHEGTFVSLVVDRTDSFKSNPIPDPILELYHCDAMPDAECLFRFCTISDKRLTPIKQYHLPTIQESDRANKKDDPQFRNKMILAFYEEVRETINDFNIQKKKALGNSECYITITQELKYLAQSKCQNKILIVFSDLMENASLNSYKSELYNTKSISNKLLKLNSIPENLKGVVVYFVYEPYNRLIEEKYLLMTQAYKLILEPKGAKVIIQASNTDYATIL